MRPAALVERFRALRALVVGDAMLDEYVEGDADRVSPEARRQIALLLAQDAEARREPDPEVVRFLRAVRVLEEIGTPEARTILERLAKAGPKTPTAREAGEALERMRRAG